MEQVAEDKKNTRLGTQIDDLGEHMHEWVDACHYLPDYDQESTTWIQELNGETYEYTISVTIKKTSPGKPIPKFSY
jgi:hypothetical protein